RSNMTRTGATSAADTLASPFCGHAEGSNVGGTADVAVFEWKQLPSATPAARARSAVPLPRTTFPETRFPRGRQGGPGSVAFGANVTYRAVGKPAIPYRSLAVTRLPRTAFSLPPAMPMPTPMNPASAVWIGTRARPLPVTVLPTIVALASGGSA